MVDLNSGVVIAAVVFLFACTAFIIVCHFWPKFRYQIVETHEKLYTTACYGALLCITIAMVTGFSMMLFFIPLSWGSIDAKGELSPIRLTIGAWFGITCSITVALGFIRAYAAQREVLVFRTKNLLMELQCDINKPHRKSAEDLIQRFNAIVDIIPPSWWKDYQHEHRIVSMDIEKLVGRKRCEIASTKSSGNPWMFEESYISYVKHNAHNFEPSLCYIEEREPSARQ